MVLLMLSLAQFAATTSVDVSQIRPIQMLKLERLTIAMAEHEGWICPGDKNYQNGSVSFRNNNPGNLRSSPLEIGVRDGFALFRTEADGWAGFRWDIAQKARGQTMTKLSGNSTLSDLIHVWAPSSDGNDPDGYLASILRMTGFSAEMKLFELLQ